MRIVQSLAGAVLAVALSRHGWEIEAEPGREFTFRRGERTIQPFVLIGEMLESDRSAEAWVAEFEEAGVADVALGGSTDGARERRGMCR